MMDMKGDESHLKKTLNAAAAIDIGSSAIRMKIAQREGDELIELENLEYPLNLGHETFSYGRLRFATMEAGAEMLSNYYSVAREYGVPNRNIRVHATTALREAQNRDYIVDQIRIKTNKTVNVLEDGEEKTIIFRESLRRIMSSLKTIPEIFFMVYIGTGSVGLALVKGKNIVYSQNVKMGSLRLNEMLSDITDYSPGGFNAALDEYLNAQTHIIRRQLSGNEIKGFVAVGREVDLIASLCSVDGEGPVRHVDRKELFSLYKSIASQPPETLQQRFALEEEQAQALLPSLSLYIKLMEFTNAEKAYMPAVAMTDAMLFKLLFPKEFKEFNRTFIESTVASARFMAARYGYHQAHSEEVEKYSLEIFDNLRSIHGFSRSERLYLQVAAILHDIGKFVDAKHHDEITAHLLLDSSIIGVTEREKAIIANIARYHSDDVPEESHAMFMRLSAEDRLMVAKLSAIIRMADALDRSHLQKLGSLKLRLEDDRLTVQAGAKCDTALEEWTFAYKSKFFEEVFGVKCELKVKDGHANEH